MYLTKIQNPTSNGPWNIFKNVRSHISCHSPKLVTTQRSSTVKWIQNILVYLNNEVYIATKVHESQVMQQPWLYLLVWYKIKTYIGHRVYLKIHFLRHIKVHRMQPPSTSHPQLPRFPSWKQLPYFLYIPPERLYAYTSIHSYTLFSSFLHKYVVLNLAFFHLVIYSGDLSYQ